MKKRRCFPKAALSAVLILLFLLPACTMIVPIDRDPDAAEEEEDGREEEAAEEGSVPGGSEPAGGNTQDRQDETPASGGPAVSYTPDIPDEPAYPAAPSDNPLTLVGSVPDSVRCQHRVLFRQKGDGFAFVTARGEEPLQEVFSDISQITDLFYAVKSDSEDINRTGLVTADGEMLLPCEAAYITGWRTGDKDIYSDRFLRVVYATGVTENKDEAFFFVSKEGNPLAIQPKEGDTLYSGYARVYDAAEKRFVEGLTITDSSTFLLRDLGDGTFFLDRNAGNAICRADGSEIMQFGSAYAEAGCGIVLATDSYLKEARVYSAGGDLLAQVSTGPAAQYNIFSMNGRSYISALKDGQYSLLYPDGSPALSGSWTKILSFNGLAAAVTQEDRILLVKSSGDVLFSVDVDPGNQPYASSMPFGFWEIDSGDRHFLVAPDGRYAESEKYIPDSLVIARRKEDFGQTNRYDAFILNDLDFTLTADGDFNAVTFGYAYATVERDGGRGNALFDLFTGAQVLPPQYMNIYCINGYIWAENLSSNEFEIYRLNRVYD